MISLHILHKLFSVFLYECYMYLKHCIEIIQCNQIEIYPLVPPLIFFLQFWCKKRWQSWCIYTGRYSSHIACDIRRCNLLHRVNAKLRRWTSHETHRVGVGSFSTFATKLQQFANGHLKKKCFRNSQ